jgi:hypothetical protein
MLGRRPYRRLIAAARNFRKGNSRIFWQASIYLSMWHLAR